MSETTDALYRRWLPELWEAAPERIPVLARELFTPDAVGHWPGADHHGPDAIAANVVQSVTMFEDVTVRVLHGPLVDGELLAARWEFRGNLAEAVDGVPAEAGTPMRLVGMDLFRVENGRLAEYWVQSSFTEV